MKEESLIDLEIQHAKKVAKIIPLLENMDTSLIDDKKLLQKKYWNKEKNNSFSYSGEKK